MAKTVAPKNKITEKLMKKGLATAHKKHKDDETVIQEGMNLPEGIEKGVAQLTEAGLFEHKEGDKGPKGEAYARFTGIVKTPVEHGGIKCKGKRVSVFIPLHDTPQASKKKKLDDHWADLLNELRKFGVDTSEIEADDIEQAMADLLEEAPHFHFRTWKGKKQTTGPYKDREPRVQEQFQGVCEYDEEEDPDDVVTTDDEEEEVEEEEDEKPAPKTKTATGGKKPPVEEEEEAEDEEEAVDHTANGRAADKGVEAAIDALTEAASEAGLDPDEYDSWLKLAKALNEAGESTEEEEEADDEEEGEPEPPTEGEIRVYEGTEVIVGKVNVKKKTANVTDAENDDLYENVPWDDLKEA